jgi:hypothetical protein
MLINIYKTDEAKTGVDAGKGMRSTEPLTAPDEPTGASVPVGSTMKPAGARRGAADDADNRTLARSFPFEYSAAPDR